MRDESSDAADWLVRLDAEGVLESDGEAAWDVERLKSLHPEFANWVDESLDRRISFLRVASTWDRTQRLAALSSGVSSNPTSMLKERWQAPKLAAVAACLTCALIVGGMGWFSLAARVQETETVNLQTGIGESRQVTLPDESLVLVNTNTELLFTEYRDRREVVLSSGEAFFDVAHLEGNEFSISAGAAEITVTGTQFSVERLNDTLEVIVSEGSVRVESDEQTISLTAGMRALITGRRLAVDKLDKAQVDELLAWREGRIYFDETPLADAIKEINRYNKLQLRLDGDAIADQRIGGAFSVYNAREFAQALEVVLGAEVQEGFGELVVSMK